MNGQLKQAAEHELHGKPEHSFVQASCKRPWGGRSTGGWWMGRGDPPASWACGPPALSPSLKTMTQVCRSNQVPVIHTMPYNASVVMPTKGIKDMRPSHAVTISRDVTEAGLCHAAPYVVTYCTLLLANQLGLLLKVHGSLGSRSVTDHLTLVYACCLHWSWWFGFAQLCIAPRCHPNSQYAC